MFFWAISSITLQEAYLTQQLFELDQIQFLHILDIAHFELASAEITAITGTSGSGKSTLLRLLNKLSSPTAGTIRYNGQDLDSLDSVNHRRHVAMLRQNPAIFPGTVRDNLLAGLAFQHKPPVDDNRLREVINALQLRVDLEQYADVLSGGEKQRLAIGRLMLLDPPVWLLDEPSSALDRNTEDQLIALLAGHVRRHGQTLVMITHTPELAKRYADRVIVLEAGRIVSDRRNIPEGEVHG
jgi:putative ABC transport system ATP-binding protein